MNNLDSNYYLKYLKYKKKYLELKGGDLSTKIKTKVFGKSTQTFSNMEQLYDHYGMFVTPDDYKEKEDDKKKYKTFLEYVKIIKKNWNEFIQMEVIIDMINAGFMYNQIISSEVAPKDLIFHTVMLNEKFISPLDFFIRAIAQGHLDLLAKTDYQPLKGNFITMNSVAKAALKKKYEEEFKDKTGVDPFRFKDYAVKMLNKIKKVEQFKINDEWMRENPRHIIGEVRWATLINKSMEDREKENNVYVKIKINENDPNVPKYQGETGIAYNFIDKNVLMVIMRDKNSIRITTDKVVFLAGYGHEPKSALDDIHNFNGIIDAMKDITSKIEGISIEEILNETGLSNYNDWTWWPDLKSNEITL